MKNKLAFKKTDIIAIDSFKYIVYDLKKDYVELLPIDFINRETKLDISLIPRMKVNYDALVNCQKLDKSELFFMLNNKNPLIREMLELFFDEVRK